DVGNGVAVDAGGNVVIIGTAAGTVNFGGGPITANGYRIVVAKFSPAGGHLWSRGFGDSFSNSGNAVAVDPIGKVVVTGTFQAAVNFGTGSLISAGRSDIFVARYSADGVPLATQRFGGADSDAGNGVAVDRSGRPVVTGSYRLGVDFGGTVLGGAGMDDIFLAGLR